MDELALRRLADHGLAGAEPLGELVAWCWDRCDSTGDGRFASIARTLQIIADNWDQAGAFTTEGVSGLNQVLARHLASVLDAPTPEEATGLGRLMREEIVAILDDPASFPG